MLGALFSAGSSLLGGLLGQKSAKKAQKQQIKASKEQALMAKQASDEANATQLKIADQNVALQKEFAQNGVQWKAKDSLAAGVHPLFGLGAQTTSFSPVSVGSSTPSYYGDSSRTPDMSMANAVSNMGQDIGRAIDATQTQAQRLLTGFQLERAKLENDLLRVNIARQSQATNPSMPSANQPWLIDGQGSTATTGETGRGITLTNQGHDPVPINEVSYTWDGKGLTPQFSKDLADRMDENWIGSTLWGWKNYGKPSLGLEGLKPSQKEYPLPPGMHWGWDQGHFRYVPTKNFIPGSHKERRSFLR